MHSLLHPVGRRAPPPFPTSAVLARCRSCFAHRCPSCRFPLPPQRPALVKGNLQLFSVEQQRSQSLEAHAAVFASFTVRAGHVKWQGGGGAVEARITCMGHPMEMEMPR